MPTTALHGPHLPLADPINLPARQNKARMAFAFGPFILQLGRQRLLKDGVPIRIGSRSLEILAVLVERPGELIGKRELVSRVWPDLFVEEANLKTNIVGLRRVLGDDPAAPEYVATIVGRGYRFIADVQAHSFPCAAADPYNSHGLTNSWPEGHKPSAPDRDLMSGSGTLIDQ